MEEEKMTKERMGEIALSIVKWDLKKRDISDKDKIKDLIRVTSKNTGVGGEELRRFYLDLVKSIYEDTVDMLDKVDVKSFGKTQSEKVGFHNYFKGGNQK